MFCQRSRALSRTAKCDVWSAAELVEDERAYGRWKLGSYVDLVFGREETAARFSFFHHEDLARSLAELLKKAPDIPAACEAIVRRCCYYHAAQQADSQPQSVAVPAGEPALQSPQPEAGFYITLYLSGYGEDEHEARQRWQVVLQLTGNALWQLSARFRKHCVQSG